MRLPDFSADAALNSLREEMGATEQGDISLPAGAKRLSEEELQILTADGIDVASLLEVRALADGTLAYRGRRVFVYDRNFVLPGPQSAREEEWPRFHVADCPKLRQLRAWSHGRQYVVSAEVGLMQKKQLRACQDCLVELKYEGIDKKAKLSRPSIVHAFTVERFYHLWPRDLPEAPGSTGEPDVELDDFGGDFGEHAVAAMELAQYRCTKCGIDLAAPELRRFLHVHHREVVRYDNPLSELVVLCIGCHANQSGHGLMRALLDFSEFSVLARG